MSGLSGLSGLHLSFEGWAAHACHAAIEVPNTPITVDVTTQAQLEEVLTATSGSFCCSVQQVTLHVAVTQAETDVPQLYLSAGRIGHRAVVPLLNKQQEGEAASFTFGFDNGGVGWPLWKLYYHKAEAAVHLPSGMAFSGASVLLRPHYDGEGELFERMSFPVTASDGGAAGVHNAHFENGLFSLSALPVTA